MSSRCKQCGEKIVETGNYSFKILPAKRIPKKARKLMKSLEGSVGEKQQRQSSSWGVTKFRKFLEERSKPANFLELTCGKCGGVSKIKMEKKFQGKIPIESNKEKSKPSSSVIISDKSVTRKKKKDVTAGLTLPSSSHSTHSRQEVGAGRTTFDQKNQRSNQNNQRGGRGGKRPGASNAQKEAKRKTDLESLNKILFQSKKAKKSGSTLEDFLSSI